MSQQMPVQQQSMQRVPACQNQPSVENQIVAMKGEFARAIGGSSPAEQQKRAERFARVCITAFRQNPELQKCSPVSILGAMMTCAQLQLEPNTPAGLAYLVPRWNSRLRSMECQFQCGYRGLLELMYRSGAVASFNADVVYRQEIEAGLFQYTSGVRPSIEHRIDLLDNGARTGRSEDIVAAYACAVLRSGEPVIRVVTRREIDEAMNMSGGKSGPSAVWKSHYASMAIKTAIHRLSKWLPTTRVDEAFEAEAQYGQPSEVKVEVQQQSSSLSLEAMNAMMQTQSHPAPAEQGAEAPAVEQAAAVEAEPEAQQASHVQPEPKSAAKAERPASFRPARESQPARRTAVQAPLMPAPEQTEADIRENYSDHLFYANIDRTAADAACARMVETGEARNMLDAMRVFTERKASL